jgi:hypothetical protein
MESIREKIDTFRIKASEKNFNAAWEVLADEMTKYFGENCYWIFYRKEHWKIRDAFNICQEKKISSFKYFMGILKNLK